MTLWSSGGVMVECESSGRDKMAVPRSSDAEPADASRLLAHSRLLDSVAAFTHHRDVDALDHSLVLSLAELTSARSVSLGKYTTDNHGRLRTVVRCTVGAHGHYELRVFEPAPNDPSLHLLRQGLERVDAHEELGAEGLHRLIVPILSEGRAVGALQLESDLPCGDSRPLVAGFARIYANYTALLNESERDKLTGLYNRRTFERHLQRLLQPDPDAIATEALDERRNVAPSARNQVWLAILDIDHFKRINDSYGHVYGDEVILLLAQQMRACFRQSDVLFRFGGEEFVILLAAHDEAIVRTVLERFRLRMAEHVFPQVEHVTVSIGYARIGEHDYPATILERADKALYFAKEHGRNCVHGFEALTAQGLLGGDTQAGSIDLF
jgi:diguanylate cyclase (GGDEF)-like protein